MDTGAWGGRIDGGVMRRKLLTKECDCVVGLPMQKAAEMNFASSRPYLGAYFALAIPRGGRRVETVEELEGMEIGSPVNSPRGVSCTRGAGTPPSATGTLGKSCRLWTVASWMWALYGHRLAAGTYSTTPS